MAVGRWYRSGCIDTNTKVWLEERTQKLWNMVVAGAVCAGQGQIMRVLGPMVGCPKMYLGAIFLINQLINFWGCTESLLGFPDGTSSKEPACQCRRHKRREFNPWMGKIPWRRAWQPTPVFLPGESHGQRKLAGYSPWGHKELDTTEATQHTCWLLGWSAKQRQRRAPGSLHDEANELCWIIGCINRVLQKLRWQKEHEPWIPSGFKATFVIYFILLPSCDSWGRKESDTTERLNRTD